jgi:hypothetical protein
MNVYAKPGSVLAHHKFFRNRSTNAILACYKFRIGKRQKSGIFSEVKAGAIKGPNNVIVQLKCRAPPCHRRAKGAVTFGGMIGSILARNPQNDFDFEFCVSRINMTYY